MRLLRALRPVALVLVVLLLAACGSRLDPNEVATANGGAVGNGALVGADGVPLADDGSGLVGSGDTGGIGSGTGGDAGGTGDAGSAGGSGGSGDTGGGDTGGGSATGGVKAASCDGFKNTTGITDKTITIANIADISGPVPGIFESSQIATRAYVEYFNSTSDICGRKLQVQLLDSRADAGADQQGYTKACAEAFAAVGSMSAFDSGGASTAQGCGLPDIRTINVSPERQACSTCFAAYPVTASKVPVAGAKWMAQKFPAAVKKAAVLSINAGAAPINARNIAAGYERGGGWDVVYEQTIDVAEFNFAPYVQQMKDKGVRAVMYFGPYQNTVKIQQAMQQQGFKPDFFLQDPTIYDPRYVEQAGSLANGTYVYSANDLFENKSNPEIQLYLSWINQVKPGAAPNFYGLYAWSAARLFVETAIALGGKLTRSSMVSALNGTTSWNGNGAHTAMNLNTSVTPPCQKILQYSGGWKQASPGNYLCGPVVDSGIG